MKFVVPVILIFVACACASTPATQLKPEIKQIGVFDLSLQKDDFTDTPTPMLTTYDADQKNAMLGWKCFREGLAVLAGISGPVSRGSDTVSVRFRFDQGEPSDSDVWLISRDSGFPLAYLRPNLVEKFTLSGLGASSVRLEVTQPRTGAREVYRFALSGLDAGLKQMPCVSD